MKHAVLLAAALAVAVSCSPEIYTHYLDVRKPSDSGLDLSRKSMAMVFMEGADSAFNRSAASSMARALEEDYFDGETVIGLYKIPQADSLSLELMHSLVMDTGQDVVFLMNSSLGEAVMGTNQEVRNARNVDSAYVCQAQIPLNTELFIYDSLGEDKIIKYSGSAVLKPRVFNSGLTPEENLKDQARRVANVGEAESIGDRVARRFVSNWQTESFSFYYYDDMNSEPWLNALVKALEGRLADAVDGWAPFLKANDDRQKACACYNIAMAFYLLGDLDLSSRWLDQAEALYSDLTLLRGLRSRITSRQRDTNK